jgi:hypothetical protein
MRPFHFPAERRRPSPLYRPAAWTVMRTSSPRPVPPVREVPKAMRHASANHRLSVACQGTSRGPFLWAKLRLEKRESTGRSRAVPGCPYREKGVSRADTVFLTPFSSVRPWQRFDQNIATLDNIQYHAASIK